MIYVRTRVDQWLRKSRLMETFGDNIDFTGAGGNGGNDAGTDASGAVNHNDAPDINEPDPDPDKNPDKGEGEDKDGKDNQQADISSTGGLEPGSKIEVGTDSYTVADNGDILDKDGKVFKEAKDVAEWMKSFDVEDATDEDKALTIDSITKALGTEIVGEDGKPVTFTNDVAGVKAYVDSVINIRSNEIQQAALNKLYSDNPELKSFIDYCRVNGTSRGYGQLPDRTGIKVEDNNEAQQIAIIKAAAAEFGNKALNDNYIEYLKSTGELANEAKTQLANLQAADAQRKEAIEKQAAEAEQAEYEATVNYWKEVSRKVKSRNIGGYKIPESVVREVNGQKITSTPDDFFNFLYRQDEDKDGNRMSGYQRYLNNLSDEELLDKDMLDAWLAFTGGTYKDLVKMAIKEKEVAKLRLVAKDKGQKTVRVTKPADNAKTDINNIRWS